MNKLFLFSCLIISPLLTSAQPAKVAACAACHGAKGDAPIAPNYPKLAGQNAAYIVSALQAYKNGDRKGGLAVLMNAQAASLTDAEMKELADYYAAQ